jgi:hypothetical protein
VRKLPPNVAKLWYEVWYANPRDNSRATRIDARRRSEKRAREIAAELMDKGIAHKPNGAWIVEVNRFKRSPV